MPTCVDSRSLSSLRASSPLGHPRKDTAGAASEASCERIGAGREHSPQSSRGLLRSPLTPQIHVSHETLIGELACRLFAEWPTNPQVDGKKIIN